MLGTEWCMATALNLGPLVLEERRKFVFVLVEKGGGEEGEKKGCILRDDLHILFETNNSCYLFV